MILLPLPKKIEEKEGTLFLRLDTMIVIDPGCPQGAAVYARMLKEEILTWSGLELSVNRGKRQEGDISLAVDQSLKENAYELVIGEDGAFLSGGSLNALGWAVQTLRQIVRQCAGLLPALRIEDEPQLENRGFYHDVTRGRVQTLEQLERMADTMAFYKLNQLQLNVEHTYLFRGMSELWRDETPLTAEEIMELDQYCYDRGIELVPSLATFGHLYKLLQTRTYEQLCELPGSAGHPFGFRYRMEHHTVNVSNPDAIKLIEAMMEEYMSLFRTDKFNICADETFDLGKGRSKKLADAKGVGTLYVDYIMELFDFLIRRGKTPMFWGDIICRHPELYDRLPKGVICLNWGYSPTQPDKETRILHEVGATQYVCPGACGWNTWINLLTNSYKNIRLMTDYARKYGAVGMLNTDWGDFGHVNHPVFSIPGLIYGAVFSWGGDVPDYEELNSQISMLEFGDRSGQLLTTIGDISDEMRFSWHHAVTLREWTLAGVPREKLQETFHEEKIDKVADSNALILERQEKLRLISRQMDSSSRWIMAHIQAGLDAIRIWNKVGLYLSQVRDGKGPEDQDACALASELETCLHHYQKLWRSNSKEGDLGHITEVFCWYADLLRSLI